MKNLKTTSPDTLASISARVSVVSAGFSDQQVALRRKLRSVMRDVPAATKASEEDAPSSFGSSWLPGPLSYPWLLMFASVPKIIDNLLRHV